MYGFILNTPSDRNILGISHDDMNQEADIDSDD